MVANFFYFIPEAYKILEGFGAFSWVTEESGGVIQCHNFGTVIIKPLTVLFGDAEVALYKTHGRYSAKAYDYFGLKKFQLRIEPLEAGCLLIGERIAVFGRAALYCVGDIYFAAVEVDHCQHIVKQFSGAAYERLALKIFLFTGAFAYKQNLCILAAHAENNVCAGLAKLAVSA